MDKKCKTFNRSTMYNVCNVNNDHNFFRDVTEYALIYVSIGSFNVPNTFQ